VLVVLYTDEGLLSRKLKC